MITDIFTKIKIKSIIYILTNFLASGIHTWLTTEKIIEIFVQANPRKLKFKRVGEYVDGVKFYLQISEEFSFISENMIF